MIKNILEYFTHTSTWKGLFAILTAAGVSFQPEHQQAILTAGLAVIGAIQVFVDDHDVTKKVQ